MIGLTGGMAQAASPSGEPCAPTPMTLTDRHYCLSEVRLEDGFEYDGDTVIGTRTALYTLEIKDGKIAAIHAANAALPAGVPRYQAQGQLLLPAFRDMHIHLDKTFYSGPWQAPRPRQGKTIMDMIALEQTLIPKLLPTSQQRAENLIALLQSKGSTVARSHCNIDPVSGLKSLEHLQRALENHQADFSCEIVAFPQHGLLHSRVDALMREAMQMGVQYVGGLDPTNVDGAMEKSLDAMFQIALDTGKGVDIHLHETSRPGRRHQLHDRHRGEKPGAARQGHHQPRFRPDHADAGRTGGNRHPAGGAADHHRLHGADRQPDDAAAAAQRERGVRDDRHRQRDRPLVAVRHRRHPGEGQPVRPAVPRLRRVSPVARMAISTGGVLPLDDKGQRAWPKAGDAAEFVLVNASCSAEAVARLPARSATFHQGALVAGQVSKA